VTTPHAVPILTWFLHCTSLGGAPLANVRMLLVDNNAGPEEIKTTPLHISISAASNSDDIGGSV